MDAVLEAPCTALDRDQLLDVGLGANPVSGADPESPGCSWPVLSGREPSFGINFPGFLRNGIDDIHLVGTELGYYEKTEITGYEAAYGDVEDLRANGDCTLFVGLDDDVVLQLAISWYPGDPCAFIADVASAVVETVMG